MKQVSSWRVEVTQDENVSIVVGLIGSKTSGESVGTCHSFVVTITLAIRPE